MISESWSKRAKIARHSPRPHGRVLCKLADSANFLPWHLVLSVPLAYYGNGGSSVSRPGGILYIVISPCKMFNCCWGCVGYKFSYSIFEKWRFYGNKRGQIVWKMKLWWYYSPVGITGTSRSPLPPFSLSSLPPNRTGFDFSYFIILFDYIYNFLLTLTMPLFMIFPPIVPREGWRFVPLLRDRSVPKHFSWFIENGKFSFDYYYKIGVRTTQPQAALIMSKRRVKGVNYIITADDEEQSGTLKDGVIPWCRHWKQTRCAPKMERCANYERKKSQVPEYTNTNIIYMSLSLFFSSRPYDTKEVQKN